MIEDPTISFVAKVIVNRIVEDIMPEKREEFFISGKYKEWHEYAAHIIGGYFTKKT